MRCLVERLLHFVDVLVELWQVHERVDVGAVHVEFLRTAVQHDEAAHVAIRGLHIGERARDAILHTDGLVHQLPRVQLACVRDDLLGEYFLATRQLHAHCAPILHQNFLHSGFHQHTPAGAFDDRNGTLSNAARAALRLPRAILLLPHHALAHEPA